MVNDVTDTPIGSPEASANRPASPGIGTSDAKAGNGGTPEASAAAAPRAASVAVGEARELVVVRDLTRTQIVQYAGASGDFNPVHTDDRFAVEAAGYPSVFAHGMLTMGMAGRVLTDWFGPEALVRYAARFRAQVFPGATLTVRARVESVDDAGTAALTLAVTDQDDVVVMTGDATVRVGLGPRVASESQPSRVRATGDAASTPE